MMHFVAFKVESISDKRSFKTDDDTNYLLRAYATATLNDKLHTCFRDQQYFISQEHGQTKERALFVVAITDA